jgi:hypothetical protein
MVGVTRQSDLRNATDVGLLFNLGVIQKPFNFSSYRDIESFDITPRSLGQELFKHCQGDRGRIKPDLVEVATAHLHNVIPPPPRQFNIFVDEMTDSMKPDDAPYYQIAIAPLELTDNAMIKKKHYLSREDFIADLQLRLGYGDRAIEKFFAQSERHGTLEGHPLSEEDASYFGWHSDYDKH